MSIEPAEYNLCFSFLVHEYAEPYEDIHMPANFWDYSAALQNNKYLCSKAQMVFGVCISLRFQPSVFPVLGEDDGA